MNRIRELRDAVGMTGEDLAVAIGTTAAQISRLESGERRLTVDWMEKIAQALKVSPSDLISNTVTGLVPDLELVIIEGELGKAAQTAAKHGVQFYRVIGRSVERTGLTIGAVVPVDQIGAETTQVAKNGDVLVVAMGRDQILVLRQFLSPDLLITNHNGVNSVTSTSDKSMKARVLGIVMRD